MSSREGEEMTEDNREDAYPETGMIPVSTGLIAVPTGHISVPDSVRQAGQEIARNHPGDKLSSARLFGYVLLLGALTALGPFTVDMYLPAFPMLQGEFDASEGAVQLTLTGTMVGFALGQLIVPRSSCWAARASSWAWAPPEARSSRWRWCATCSAGDGSSSCSRASRSSRGSPP
jgi:hypothetical protein